MSRQKAKEARETILKLTKDAEWDPDLHREIHGLHRCFKCGSLDFDEPLDTDGELILCCSECPEEDEHQ